MSVSLRPRDAMLAGVLLCFAFGCSSFNGTPPTTTLAANNLAGDAASTPAQPPRTIVAATDTATVITLKANLRERSNKSESGVARVERGDVLTLIGTKPTGSWFRVQHAGTGAQGWINSNTIRLNYPQLQSVTPAPTYDYSTTPATKPAPAPRIRAPFERRTERTGYVTRTGEKYHSAGCQYLRRSQIPVTLSEARASYSPCSRCSPPQ